MHSRERSILGFDSKKYEERGQNGGNKPEDWSLRSKRSLLESSIRGEVLPRRRSKEGASSSPERMRENVRGNNGEE
jgi:hypothetical protein